jgi:hypothetical protein
MYFEQVNVNILILIMLFLIIIAPIILIHKLHNTAPSALSIEPALPIVTIEKGSNNSAAEFAYAYRPLKQYTHADVSDLFKNL